MPTLTNQQLHRLVKPLLPFASKDPSLPVLCAVHFMPDESDILTAYATDRYRVGRMKLEGLKAEGFTATLSLKAVRFLLTTFKRNAIGGELALSYEPVEEGGDGPGTVHVSGESGDVWGKVELSITEAASQADRGYKYPKVESLFPAAGELPRAEETFHGAYLADMGSVAAGSIMPVAVQLNMTPGKAAIFRHADMGAEFAGLLMPKRMPRQEDDI